MTPHIAAKPPKTQVIPRGRVRFWVQVMVALMVGPVAIVVLLALVLQRAIVLVLQQLTIKIARQLEQF